MHTESIESPVFTNNDWSYFLRSSVTVCFGGQKKGMKLRSPSQFFFRQNNRLFVVFLAVFRVLCVRVFFAPRRAFYVYAHRHPGTRSAGASVLIFHRLRQRYSYQLLGYKLETGRNYIASKDTTILIGNAVPQPKCTACCTRKIYLFCIHQTRIRQG